VNARTSTAHSLQTIQRALNALLPEDIAVRTVREEDWSFHARFSAWRRDYRYLILNELAPSPLLRTRALHVPEQLDEGSMHAASQKLLGEHDFASFGVATTGGSTVRQCYHAACRREEYDGRRLIAVELAASGFLRHMVRAVVGTLLLVGWGRLDPAGVGTILASCDRKLAGPTAPPHGLYLETVFYQEGPPARTARGLEEPA
jgi:tRNA pseudouridine38-40 synthase